MLNVSPTHTAITNQAASNRRATRKAHLMQRCTGTAPSMANAILAAILALVTSGPANAFEIRHSLEIPPESDWQIPAQWDMRELKIFYWTDFGLEWAKSGTHKKTMPTEEAIRNVALRSRDFAEAVIDLEGGIWALPCCDGLPGYGKKERDTLQRNLANTVTVLTRLRRDNATTRFGFWAKPPSAASQRFMRRQAGSDVTQLEDPWGIWHRHQATIATALRDHIDFCVIDGYQWDPDIDRTLRFYADSKAACDYLYDAPVALYIWFKRPMVGGGGEFLDQATFRAMLDWARTNLDHDDMLVLWAGRHHLSMCGDTVCPRSVINIVEPGPHPENPSPSNSWIIDNRDRADMRDFKEAQWIKEFERLLQDQGQLAPRGD